MRVLCSVAPNAEPRRVLGDAHELAVSAARAGCAHTHWWVRRAAVEAFGRLGARGVFIPELTSTSSRLLWTVS